MAVLTTLSPEDTLVDELGNPLTDDTTGTTSLLPAWFGPDDSFPTLIFAGGAPPQQQLYTYSVFTM